MTSATADGHDFYAICVNADTGKIIYNEKVFHSDNPEPLGNGASMNCYATPSPAIEPGRVYVHFGSFVICVEAATGQSVWASRLGGNFESSPIYAGGRLCFFNQQGVTTVLKPGRACDILATNKLDDLFMASPAVSGESLFLRGKTRLYRVEDPPPTSKPSP
jgi:outer membrane protein assembly factor BamB